MWWTSFSVLLDSLLVVNAGGDCVVVTDRTVVPAARWTRGHGTGPDAPGHTVPGRPAPIGISKSVRTTVTV
jgi:hypothetical protein